MDSNKLYRFRLHRNDKLEGNSGMIFTSRHLSRRNFQLFDSQSTVNSQHHSGVTGIDITPNVNVLITLAVATYSRFHVCEGHQFIDLFPYFINLGYAVYYRFVRW